jgi:hypothetical protein
MHIPALVQFHSSFDAASGRGPQPLTRGPQPMTSSVTRQTCLPRSSRSATARARTSSTTTALASKIPSATSQTRTERTVEFLCSRASAGLFVRATSRLMRQARCCSADRHRGSSRRASWWTGRIPARTSMAACTVPRAIARTSESSSTGRNPTGVPAWVGADPAAGAGRTCGGGFPAIPGRWPALIGVTAVIAFPLISGRDSWKPGP